VAMAWFALRIFPVYPTVIASNSMYPDIFCVEMSGGQKKSHSITEEELLDAVFSSGLDCIDTEPYIVREEPSDAKSFTHIADPLEHSAELSLWKARVQITSPHVKHWKDIAWIERPINSSGNDWVLHNEEVRIFIEEDFDINPILKLSSENFQKGLKLEKDRSKYIREFELPLYSDTVAFMSARHLDMVPSGICINCLNEGLLSDIDIECGHCGSNMIMYYDDTFPADAGVVREVRNYLTWLTEIKIEK